MSLMIYEKGVSASHFSKTYLLKWDFFLLFLVKGEEIMENSSTVLYIQKDWTGKFGKLEQGKKKKAMFREWLACLSYKDWDWMGIWSSHRDRQWRGVDDEQVNGGKQRLCLLPKLLWINSS